MNVKVQKWHHSPLHVFVPDTIYIVTASTLHKKLIFNSDERLRMLQDTLMNVTESYGWILQAWSIFSNHYHFIAKSPEDAITLRTVIRELHSITAHEVNRLDSITGRQVWFQYWDTCITYEKSYYARLNYVHNNPVKHKLVQSAEDYPFCSAGWFKEKADPELQKKVELTPYDKVKIVDDF